MSPKTKIKASWFLVSTSLLDAYTDTDPRQLAHTQEDVCYFFFKKWHGCITPASLTWTGGLEMVTHYTQMVDEDLLRVHKAHPPWITCEEGRLLRAQDNDNEKDDRCNKHQIRINCRFHAYMILGSREGPVKYVKVS